jgi:hypothetical protein
MGNRGQSSVQAGRNSVVEFSRSGQEKTEQGRVRRRKTGIFAMTFTGTLIEDLMATVERAEQRAQSDGASVVEPWFASVQENTDYDSKLLGVA